MTKKEYLARLGYKLRALPENERRDAIEYYDSYLSDAQDEAAAIAALGTPEEAAANIIVNRAAQGGGSGEERSRTSGIKTALVVILAIFALPVGLPIVIALAATAFALYVTLLAVVFSVGVTGLAVAATGPVMLLGAVLTFVQTPANALIWTGMGFAAIGAGMLLLSLTMLLLKGFPAIARFVGKIISKRKDRKNSGGPAQHQAATQAR
jgi:uncharacterized membrane protein